MSRLKTSGKPILGEDAETEIKNSSIIGTYDGECADATITNLNGLDITREVWETVFASDEYKKAIEHGWYIGFLGHPVEPDCQDFRRACIVMTEGHIDGNGKVYGTFNLINTPVGQIVKAFQDAGVIFGISVRGAGDIIDNSVDPETFVFRGFDLVTFPAFPESIPEFTQIAASTDMDKRRKYQAVCSAVTNNIDSLDTIEAVTTVQSCFAKQSSEYKMLEAQKDKILASTEVPVATAEGDPVPEAAQLPILPESVEVATENIEDADDIDPRVESMTKLYLDLKQKYDTLELAHAGLQEMYDNLLKENSRKMDSIERICSSQLNDLHKTLETVEGSLKMKTEEAEKLQREVNRSNSRLSRIQGSVSTRSKEVSDLTAEIENLRSQLKTVQASLNDTQDANRSLREDCISMSRKLQAQKKENLKYKEKVEAAQSTLESKESVISDLKCQLDETVRKQTQGAVSNRDAEMESMKSRVVAAESSLKTFQDAYADIYAKALGVRLPNLRVTASTDVASLQKMIRSSTTITMKPDILAPTQDVDPSYFDVADYDEDSDLVTL